MAAQWYWLQLKIRATSYELFGANHIWLGCQESNASNRFQFKNEMREISLNFKNNILGLLPNWSKTAQMACNYGIKFRPNKFFVV